MIHVVWPSSGSSNNHRGRGYMTGRARVVNTVFWLSYFVLLCNEIQAQPCLNLSHQESTVTNSGMGG